MQLPLGFKWYEYTWHRPFSLDDVIGLLTHLAEFTPRGYLVLRLGDMPVRSDTWLASTPSTVAK